MSPTAPPAAAGAWKVPLRGYKQGMVVPTDQLRRVRLATKSIQRELIRRSYLAADPTKLDGGWGNKTTEAVQRFQRDHGLKVDGIVYVATAKALWSQFYAWWQAALGIPENLLMGQGYLESAFDPGAEGPNPKGPEWFDRGVHQINRWYHRPGTEDPVTDEQAYDAAFSIEWSAARLHEAYAQLQSWPASVAYHNSPALGIEWARTGSAPNEQIARYVDLVYQQAAAQAPVI